MNQGHPQSDCIYFMYSDIYVSPSGSDSTGQGTAGRPYRTIQKCIDASLSGARDYYVYKKANGGDPDPSIPDGSSRFGDETAGQRPDATGGGDDMNTPTGYDQGYTGRAVRSVDRREKRTGALYGGKAYDGGDGAKVRVVGLSQIPTPFTDLLSLSKCTTGNSYQYWHLLQIHHK